uniref:non-specific protein-tyrosine kinase n=1 Tax=Saccoglossus kowalevskii TaxID=10224 RepID=A0ABM0MBG1_SACKO
CAPESINYLKFTSCSDIWGFGVTCWEMFSYGFQPWAALTGSQILQAIDAPNFQRLEKPDCCPEQYHQIMQSCWEHDPKRRPSFVELCEELPKARPMQMKALTDFAAPSAEFLSYKENDVISVLAMRTSHNGLWKGVIGSGRTGLFNSNNTVAYDPAAPSNIQHQEQQQLKQQQQIAKAKIYKKAEKPRSPSKMGKKRHQLPQKVQTVLDQADVTPTSPLKRTLTLPAEYIKSRTPDLIAVPIQIPRHGSQSSLPESDPSRCPSNLYIDKTETKKTEKSTTHESAATAKPASYFDFDDSTKASNKTDVHEM